MSHKPKPPEERYPLELTVEQQGVLLALSGLDKGIRSRIQAASPDTQPAMLTTAELEELGDVAYLNLRTTFGTEHLMLSKILDDISASLDEIENEAYQDKLKNLPRKAKVYQFKVTLKHTKPPIWRRFQTRDCTLGELHYLLQNVMGWTDSHLHQFVFDHKTYGNPAELDTGVGIGFGDGPIDENLTLLSQVRGLKPKSKLIYEYDFGDGWQHDVVLEKVLAPEEGVTYPLCLNGARACPPEDIGGAWGYADYVAAMADPRHHRHEEVKEWYTDDFDPEAFSVAEINELLRPT